MGVMRLDILLIRKFSRGLIFAKLRIKKQSFVKIKPSRIGKITLSFIKLGKYCLCRATFHITNMSFNAIREIEILTKMSKSTVLCLVSQKGVCA